VLKYQQRRSDCSIVSAANTHLLAVMCTAHTNVVFT